MSSASSNSCSGTVGGFRLLRSTSPYLLQHASNPVAWYPWGDEAIALAAAEERPIFLSIGYSACHWCHVMERESFEDEATAAVLNRHFISIKVDREERPDIDAIYMRAIMAMTGSGGWPMSVFLTPDLRPFYGGTYFPPEDRYGIPGFRRVLLEVARLWRDDRARLEHSAVTIMGNLEASGVSSVRGAEPDERLLETAADQLTAAHDRLNGGFGGPPKFPPSMALGFLMQRHVNGGRGDLLDVVTQTLDRMAAGGIHDHLGGGFHRYSVDEKWLVPHFEKMLYDNALLASTYLDAARLTGRQSYVDVAEGCLTFLLRDMRDAGGGFHAALDADSEGEEGRYYVWTRGEIVDVLGREDEQLFRRLYGVTDAGNFEGANILHLALEPETLLAESGREATQLSERMADLKARLLKRRSRRVPPGKDDKVLASWNGLALTAFAQGFKVTGRQRYRDAARGIAGFVGSQLWRNGSLRHSWRRGTAAAPANLDDYAYVGSALLDLYEIDPDIRHLELADHFADIILERFADAGAGVFHYTEVNRKHLLSRERCDTDSAVPSPAAVAAGLLLRLGRLTAARTRHEAASAWAATVAAEARQHPRACLSALNLIESLLAPAQEIVVAGAREGADTKALCETVYREYLPNAVLVHWDPEAADAEAVSAFTPLVRGRDTIQGAAAAYVCRNRTCSPPLTSAAELKRILKETSG